MTYVKPSSRAPKLSSDHFAAHPSANDLFCLVISLKKTKPTKKMYLSDAGSEIQEFTRKRESLLSV